MRHGLPHESMNSELDRKFCCPFPQARRSLGRLKTTVHSEITQAIPKRAKNCTVSSSPRFIEARPSSREEGGSRDPKVLYPNMTLKTSIPRGPHTGGRCEDHWRAPYCHPMETCRYRAHTSPCSGLWGIDGCTTRGPFRGPCCGHRHNSAIVVHICLTRQRRSFASLFVGPELTISCSGRPRRAGSLSARARPSTISTSIHKAYRLALATPGRDAWDMGTKSRESIFGASVRAAAEQAADARKAADRLACASLSAQASLMPPQTL